MYSNLGSFKDNTAHSYRGSGFTSYPPGWLPEEEAIIENFRAHRGTTGIFLHNAKSLHFIGGRVAQTAMLGIDIFGADDIIVDGMELVGNIEGDPLLCFGDRHLGIQMFPIRAPSTFKSGEHFGAKLKNLDFNRWTPKEGCTSQLFAVGITQVREPAWEAYNLLENVIHDGTSSDLVSACTYETAFASDAAIEISGDSATIYGGSGYLVGSLMTTLSGSECTDVGGCLHFCPGACLRTIEFRASNANDTYGYVMKVSDGMNTITVNRFSPNYFGNDLSEVYYEESTYSVSLPAGDFTVWFEHEDAPGVMVYPQFVYPFFEAEPTCLDYATHESITILKPPADDPRCDELIRNGNFESNIDGWQEFAADIFHSPNAGVYGGGALVTGTINPHLRVSQWLDASCLVDNAGVYVFHASYRVVDQVSNLNSAVNLPNLSKTPTGFLQFKYYDEEEQRLRGAINLFPGAIDLPELDYVTNGGDTLGVCQGDCDNDAQCEGNLKCMQRNGNEPVPGCSGTARSTRDYCYDPKYGYTAPTNFQIVSGAFTITPELAAADAGKSN
jgi:hypothetical protein